MKGNNVSHSNAKTKRRFHANLQVKRIFDPVDPSLGFLPVVVLAVETFQVFLAVLLRRHDGEDRLILNSRPGSR